MSEDDKELLDDLVVRLFLCCHTLTIPAKVGEGGRIFGSINGWHIRSALKEFGITVNRRDIAMDSGVVRRTGTYRAFINYDDSWIVMNYRVIAE